MGQYALRDIGGRRENLLALDTAVDEFGRRLALVSASSWDLPTPCVPWDVRYLAAHVIGGNRFATSILDGMAAADAIELVMSSPQLGHDALDAWRTTAATQRSAFHAKPLDASVDHPLGPIPTATFLGFRVFDITLHAWDLARSIGVDAALDPSLVEVVLGVIESSPPGMGFGISSLGRTTVSSTPQKRLLDLAGRPA